MLPAHTGIHPDMCGKEGSWADRQILYHLRLQGSLTRPQSMGCLQPGALNGTFDLLVSSFIPA